MRRPATAAVEPIGAASADPSEGLLQASPRQAATASARAARPWTLRSLRGGFMSRPHYPRKRLRQAGPPRRYDARDDAEIVAGPVAARRMLHGARAGASSWAMESAVPLPPIPSIAPPPPSV